jgi:lipid-binding SYLF domain-containing protein
MQNQLNITFLGDMTMKKMMIITLLLMPFAFTVCGCSSAKGKTPMEKRQSIADLHEEVIVTMAEKYPEIKRKIKKSPGYGVFSNLNVNLLIASAGNGFGMVVNNKTGEKTYMKMALGGVGLGLGVKDFRQLMIFQTTDALNNFVEKGWEVGAHADASAKAGDKGGAVNSAGDISSGMEIYQVTENGLALQATVSAAKYWKDKELNN